ncbi:MAG TPA: hypothetical protein VK538_08010 [Solirubrobacteraceae bacterium]|nr:hypothetical protein [Solirubrobacteraceae bacterium]
MLVVALATIAASPAIGQASARAGSSGSSGASAAPAAAATPAAGTPTPTAAAPTPPPAVVVPPDLQALEQKMLALQLNSERFSVTLSVATSPVVKGPIGGFKHIFGHVSNVAEVLLSVSGEVSLAPQAASMQVSFLGLKSNVRLIGTTLYVEEPFIKRLDGGRPWVEERNQSLHGALEEGPAPPGGVGSGPPGYARLIETVKSARSIQEIGAATIDGQATTAFKVSIDLTRLRTLSAHQRHALAKVLKPLATFELFIAEDGLPVRTREILHGRRHKGELITQSDTLAINIPVIVQPPPAAQTISEARLKRLLAHRRAHRVRHRV